MGAKQITNDITWFLEDSGLTSHPDFKVTTGLIGGSTEGTWRTRVWGVNADLACAALAEYLSHRDGSTFGSQVASNGQDIVLITQPVALRTGPKTRRP
jgi:hypothetical protein